MFLCFRPGDWLWVEWRLCRGWFEMFGGLVDGELHQWRAFEGMVFRRRRLHLCCFQTLRVLSRIWVGAEMTMAEGEGLWTRWISGWMGCGFESDFGVCDRVSQILLLQVSCNHRQCQPFFALGLIVCFLWYTYIYSSWPSDHDKPIREAYWVTGHHAILTVLLTNYLQPEMLLNLIPSRREKREMTLLTEI